MNITIVGTGYVGLTTGIVLAFLGNHVTCIDVDPEKIKGLNQNILPFYEPGLKELFFLVRNSITFTTNYHESVPDSEVVFITVGTPPLENGNPNLEFLREAAYEISKNIGNHFTVIVNKSTVPIGSGNWVENIIFDAFESNYNENPKDLLAVVSNPEFLREGSAISDTLFPDRIIIGTDNQKAVLTLYNLYKPIIERSFSPPVFVSKPDGIKTIPFVTTSLISAELIKYAANTFLALKISFINEIASLTEKVGADIVEIANGIGLDQRIGQNFLSAGIGWGGSCFGKDTNALLAMAKEYGMKMPIIEGTKTVNYQLRNKVVEKISTDIKIFKGKTIGLLGLAFKPDTDDIRDSPAIEIAKLFLERGSKVIAHDPIAIEKSKCELPYNEIRFELAAENVFNNADAVILLTAWQEYQNINWAEQKAKMRNPLIFDGRNFLNKDHLTSIGYKYMGVGR